MTLQSTCMRLWALQRSRVRIIERRIGLCQNIRKCEEYTMVRLKDIDEGNWRYPLKVSEAQKNYVSDSFAILARAYAYRNQRSRAFVIYDDETSVGMGMYHDCAELDAYDLSQIFIDARYQGRGYGKAATKLVLDAMKQDGKYGKVVLCYIEGNDAAKRLYGQFGFVEIDRDEDEIIMELKLE